MSLAAEPAIFDALDVPTVQYRSVLPLQQHSHRMQKPAYSSTTSQHQSCCQLAGYHIATRVLSWRQRRQCNAVELRARAAAPAGHWLSGLRQAIGHGHRSQPCALPSYSAGNTACQHISSSVLTADLFHLCRQHHLPAHLRQLVGGHR